MGNSSVKLLLVLAFSWISIATQAQKMDAPSIQVEKINIVRDAYGVPHMFAPTDP